MNHAFLCRYACAFTLRSEPGAARMRAAMRRTIGARTSVRRTIGARTSVRRTVRTRSWRRRNRVAGTITWPVMGIRTRSRTEWRRRRRREIPRTGMHNDHGGRRGKRVDVDADAAASDANANGGSARIEGEAEVASVCLTRRAEQDGETKENGRRDGYGSAATVGKKSSHSNVPFLKAQPRKFGRYKYCYLGW